MNHIFRFGSQELADFHRDHSTNLLVETNQGFFGDVRRVVAKVYTESIRYTVVYPGEFSVVAQLVWGQCSPKEIATYICF